VVAEPLDLSRIPSARPIETEDEERWHQRRLFDRFFRASGAQERAIDGTGLGLTTARAIVDAHGGTIALASQEGEGTTFRVRLPLAGPAVEHAASPDREAQGVI
jgi:signal transduction histidine kinase